MVSDERFADLVDEEAMYQDLILNDDQEEQQVYGENSCKSKAACRGECAVHQFPENKFGLAAQGELSISRSKLEAEEKALE
jgi:hypothetical protein